MIGKVFTGIAWCRGVLELASLRLLLVLCAILFVIVTIAVWWCWPAKPLLTAHTYAQSKTWVRSAKRNFALAGFRGADIHIPERSDDDDDTALRESQETATVHAAKAGVLLQILGLVVKHDVEAIATLASDDRDTWHRMCTAADLDPDTLELRRTDESEI